MSVCRIALTFAVQKHINSKNEKFKFSFKGRFARVLYVDLKAGDDKYVITHDKTALQFC